MTGDEFIRHCSRNSRRSTLECKVEPSQKSCSGRNVGCLDFNALCRARRPDIEVRKLGACIVCRDGAGSDICPAVGQKRCDSVLRAPQCCSPRATLTLMTLQSCL